MSALGPLIFVSPWLLIGLLLLPLLYLVLRVIPPSPRRVLFPPIKLLAGLAPESQTAHRTPWWLLLLRMLVAALIILALAGPKIDAGDTSLGRGTLVLVIDNGWAAGSDWDRRQNHALAVLGRATEQDRAVILVPTAQRAAGDLGKLQFMTAAAASAAVRAMQPQPWATDRAAALSRISALPLSRPMASIWLHDGLDGDGAAALADYLGDFGPISVRQAETPTVTLKAATGAQGALRAEVTFDRQPNAGWRGWLRATTDDGRLLWRSEVSLSPQALSSTQVVDLPLELRNDVTRLELEGAKNAAAVVLLDERYRRRTVGILSDDDIADQQTLLDGNYYISRALAPFAAVRYGPAAQLLATPDVAMIVLGDDYIIDFTARAALEAWIRKGGVLVRFAGDNLAAANLQDGSDTDGPLTPVRLRRGDRVFGGALAWGASARLAPFAADSPFQGLPQPDDVVVRKQVLAEPSLALAQRTWARLDDGTPIVTAKGDGVGWLVLVHTTANTAWSNLALSGLFVNMLKRLVSLSRSQAVDQRSTFLPPHSSLDGFGRLGAPLNTAQPLPKTEAAQGTPTRARLGPSQPPGFYGTQGAREAVNLAPTLGKIVRQKDFPLATQFGDLQAQPVINLKGVLLLLALAFLLIDGVIVLLIRGLLRQAVTLALLLSAVAASLPATVRAESDAAALQFALKASLKTHLAFVMTGDAAIDATSREGLQGLSDVLSARTAVEPGPPVGVNLERDELAFFPLLYWPINPAQAHLSAPAEARVNAYLGGGGMILFDTRDQHEVGFGGAGGRGFVKLRRMSDGIAIPPLVATPRDHVLTRSFYLLTDLPGRYRGGQVWIAKAASDSNRSVSSVVIGSHDWAAAWARDAAGRSRFPVVPGGEVQREIAYRFGVNLVMYALTGNYKADQVHIPAILERLGQ